MCRCRIMAWLRAELELKQTPMLRLPDSGAAERVIYCRWRWRWLYNTRRRRGHDEIYTAVAELLGNKSNWVCNMVRDKVC